MYFQIDILRKNNMKKYSWNETSTLYSCRSHYGNMHHNVLILLCHFVVSSTLHWTYLTYFCRLLNYMLKHFKMIVSLCTAAEVPVKFQSDRKSLNPHFAASGSHDISQ